MGHRAGPLEPAPHQYYGWSNRFDDADRRFRTVYAADQRQTALAEVVQDFRPDAATRAEFHRLFPQRPVPPAVVPREWRERMRVARARIRPAGELIDLSDPAVRARVERRHADLLAHFGLDHLDLEAVTTTDRVATQALSRRLFEDGHSGVTFASTIWRGNCHALFEGRAALVGSGRPAVIAADDRDLHEVAEAFGLTVET